MKLFPYCVWFRRMAGASLRRKSGLSVLFSLPGLISVGVMLFAAHAMAAVHPVPLDKNTDSKKCLECHDDKAKRKFVHSAMAGRLSELP